MQNRKQQSSAMNTSVLCPPNTRFLSDDVIRSVVQRAARPQRIHVAGGNLVTDIDTDSYQRKSSHQLQNLSRKTQEPMRTGTSWEGPGGIPGVARAPSDKERKRSEKPTSIRSRCQRSDDRDGVRINGVPMKRNVEHTAIAQLLYISQEAHRKRRREIQMKYRLKQDILKYTREKETEVLQEEIKMLQQQRRALSKVVTLGKCVWTVALEYCQLFRCGLKVNPPAPNIIATHFGRQLDFVKATMAPNVAFNGGFGPDDLVRSWCFLQWFDDVELKLERLVKVDDRSITAITRTSVTITERTLRILFPHLYNSDSNDRKDGKASTLADKLQDHRIIIDGSTWFEWDSVNDCVVSVWTQSDLLTPILHLLGRLEDASLVFEKARISPDFQWRSKS